MKIFSIWLMLFSILLASEPHSYGRSVYVDPTMVGSVNKNHIVRVEIVALSKNDNIIQRRVVPVYSNGRFQAVFDTDITQVKRFRVNLIRLDNHKYTLFVDKKGVISKNKKNIKFLKYFRIKKGIKQKAVGSLGGFAVSGRVST